MTCNEQRLDGVKYEDEELDHLQLSEEVLPAQVRLEGGAQGREEVVAVHQHVDAAVEEPAESCVTSANKLGGKINFVSSKLC